MKLRNLILIVVFLLSYMTSFAVETPTATVPLWQYSREYSLLERAKELGLLRKTDLSFKPLTREQFARAIIEIYNNREISPVIARKIFDELYSTFKDSVDLLLRGRNEDYIKPINNVFLYSALLSGIEKRELPYTEGYVLNRGSNGRLNFSSEIKFSNFLFYLEYEYRSEKLLRLNRGYVVWKVSGINFLFGRDIIWWGNAVNGDLLFTDNVRPWIMLKVEMDRYRKLPWIFARLGEWRFSNFFAQLEKERYRSYAHVWGMRLAWRPLENLEISGTRAIQFGGEGRPNYHSLHDFWELFTANNENVRSSDLKTHKYDNNQLASIDVTYYLSGLRDYKFQPFKGGKVYFVYAGDDAIKPVGPVRLPLPTGAAHILGISLTTGVTDLSFEYTETTDGCNGALWYSHHMYPNGYTYHGFIIGNSIGGDSKSLFFKVSRDFPFANLGFSYTYIEHGVDRKPVQEKDYLYAVTANKKLDFPYLGLLKVFSSRLYLSFSYNHVENYNYTSDNKDILLLSVGLGVQF